MLLSPKLVLTLAYGAVSQDLKTNSLRERVRLNQLDVYRKRSSRLGST